MTRGAFRNHLPYLMAAGASALLLAACSLGTPPVKQLGTPPFPPPLQPPKPGGVFVSSETADSMDPSTSAIEVSELSRDMQEPTTSGQDYYEVQAGDTLFSISNDTQTRLTELVDMNDLEPPYRLEPGQQLRLPRRQQAAPSEQEKEGTPETAAEDAPARLDEPGSDSDGKTVRNNRDSQAEEAPDMSEPESGDIPVAAKTGPIGDPPGLTGQGFGWPLEGEIISRYGAQSDGRHNDGINIAAPEGSVVRASENGVVAYAGNELRGFGNLLLIRHQDGWVSAYGHNSRLLVGRGVKVERGQPIAEVGTSGSVSKPQLHFELRKGTRAMDPLEILED